jgi:hypothetical protein
MTVFFVSPETAGWGRKCHGEAARFVLTKARGDVFARFHAVAAKLRSRTQSSHFGLLGPVLRLPQLLYRWRNQSEIFWILPRTFSESSRFVSRSEEWLTELKLCSTVLSDKCQHSRSNTPQTLHSLFNYQSNVFTLHNKAGVYSVVI